MSFLIALAGLVLLVAGGDLLVRGSVAIARRLAVSPLLIGLTLVGFGTSTPELFTSITAALEGAPGIAVGNVVGSNTANILLILGLAAAIRPMAVHPAALRRDGSVTLLAALACTGLVLIGQLELIGGILLLLGLLLYLGITYRVERRSRDEAATLHAAEAETAGALPQGWLPALAFVLGGFALIFLGADWLVDGAIVLAQAAGVSDTLVGLTLVAIGTSLPELVASVMASIRRQGDISIGNVLGSNIYNVLGVLGATALVQPIPVPGEIARLDIWVMLAATLLLMLFAFTGGRLTRWEGGTLLALYLAYLAALALLAF
ncbi:MAG: calcium/sodium antiporter [Sneathiellaceae bacterium]